MPTNDSSTIKNLLTIFVCAGASTTINLTIPMKHILNSLGIFGPAGGMILFGGFIFVLWVTLAHLTTGCKKLSGVSTAILTPAFCMLVSPWYGVVDPPWFGIYGIIAFLIMGLMIEFSCKSKLSFARLGIGGGVANLLCLTVTWLAIGFHAHIWPSVRFLPFYLAIAFMSGAVGAVIPLMLIEKTRKHETL